LKTIFKIAAYGVAEDYKESLIPCVIRSLGYSIDWTHANTADLILFGPFYSISRKQKWIPKPLRKYFDQLENFSNRVTLLHTPENQRQDVVASTYKITSNIVFDDDYHYRVPYWMEVLNWEHEGVIGNSNPRFGKLLEISELATPIGGDFLKKPFQAALFASHLREPRATLLKIVSKMMPVHGYGSCFDARIKDHSSSGLFKYDILKNYAFNLCPENSMHPGYYTEKIPEAIIAGCLPITWTDSNVSIDFNPKAMINLAELMYDEHQSLNYIVKDKFYLNKIAEQPLILKLPTLSGLKIFLQKIISDAIS
jgi:hypothetical protein